MKSLKKIFKKLFFIFYFFLTSYFFLEIFWRGYKFFLISDQKQKTIQTIINWQEDKGIWVSDKYSGWRYLKNINFVNENNIIKTNSHGLIDNEEFSIKKPNDEFRIIVLGDSYTASIGTHNTWPQELQNILEKDLDWKKITKKKTRVINFGRDLYGVNQMERAFSTEAINFEPDLVIVNVTTDNIYRKKFYRGIHKLDNMDEIKEYAIRQVELVAKRKWFIIWPEVLSDSPLGTIFNIKPKIKTDLGRVPRYDNFKEAFEETLKSLTTIKKLFENTILIIHPYKSNVPPAKTNDKDQKKSLEALKEVKILDTYFAGKFYPVPKNILEAAKKGKRTDEWDKIVGKWFIPDGHPSDEGNIVHANSVKQIIFDYYNIKNIK